MFSTFLQELRGYLGKGFLLAVFIPTLILTSLSLAVYFEVTIGLAAALQRWIDLPLEAQLLLSFGVLIGLAFFAYLIHNLQLQITRLFEGYWEGGVLRWLYHRRRRIYEREWDYLAKQRKTIEKLLEEADAKLDTDTRDQEIVKLKQHLNKVLSYWLSYFPPPGHRGLIQPTRLGNILRASELYAQDHYGIDSVVVWPRLRPLLQGSIVETLQDKKIALDFMLLMALYAGLFTLVWCPTLALFTTRWGLFLVCAAGLPLAAICYRNAIQNGLAYSEQIKTVFDLHRYELLKAMGLKIPADHEQERLLWKMLSLFFQNNVSPRAPIYQHAIGPEEAHQYWIAEPPKADESSGLTRMQKAAGEFGRGLREVFDGKANNQP